MRESRFLLLFLFLFVAFGTLVYAIKLGYLTSFDEKIIAFANRIQTGKLTSFFKVITTIGSWRQVVIILSFVLLILFWKKQSFFALFLVLVNSLSPFLNTFLKNMFHRPRPIENPYILYDSFSFPSGHATSSIVLFSTLCFLMYHLHSNKFKPFAFFSIIMVGLIGFSRVYLGVHYPTDIIGGYLIGSMWLMLSIFIFNNFGKFILFLRRLF